MMNKDSARGFVHAGTSLAILFGAFASCGGDIATGIESANDLLYAKEYVKSERLYRRLLRRLEAQEPELDTTEDEQRRLVLDRLGKLNALYLDDYDQAIHYYKQLVLLYPRSDQAFAGLATIADIFQNKLGKHEAAIEVYQKMVHEFPITEELTGASLELREQEQTRAQLHIAHAYFALKNYDQARREARKLIERWPESNEAAQAHLQLANSFYIEGRYEEAVASYEDLLEDDPEPELTSLVLFELGNCFQEMNEAERALACYYGCLADHPDPLLVQRKIKRLRNRVEQLQPADSIHIPDYLENRLAAARSLPFDTQAKPVAENAKPATAKVDQTPSGHRGAAKNVSTKKESTNSSPRATDRRVLAEHNPANKARTELSEPTGSKQPARTDAINQAGDESPGTSQKAERPTIDEVPSTPPTEASAINSEDETEDTPDPADDTSAP